MKILIAGDSFAEVGVVHPEYSWSYLLEKHTGWNIENIGLGGTSLEWTFKKLLNIKKTKSFSSYDKIIIFITNQSRCYIPGNLKVIIKNKINENFVVDINAYTASYDNVLYWLDFIEDKNSKEYKALFAAKLYYEHLYDPDTSSIRHKHMIYEIINSIPFGKLILIPCFETYNIIPSELNKTNFILYNVSLREHDHLPNEFKKTADFFRSYSEQPIHRNHLTMNNKAVLVQHLLNLISQGSSDITYNDFSYMSIDDFHQNFCKK